MITTQTRLTALATFTALALCGGCATTATDKKTAAADSEYEYITPLGSNVPVRVKKGQQAASTSPSGTMTADQLGQAVHGAGTATPKGSN